MRKHPGLHNYRAAPYAIVAYTTRWTKVASHELLEMLIDPPANRILGGFLQEICDPVYTLSYRVRGTEVSDFVTPAWFSGSRGPYDYLGRVTAAHSVRFGFETEVGPGVGYHIVEGAPPATAVGGAPSGSARDSASIVRSARLAVGFPTTDSRSAHEPNQTYSS